MGWKLKTALNTLAKILSQLSSMEPDTIDHVNASLATVYSDIKSINNGRIPLSEFKYFSAITESMKKTVEHDKVLAVNSIDEIRYGEDERQRKYIRENSEASKRGVSIHRIIIIRRTNLTNSSYVKSFKSIIDQICNDKIHVSLVWRDKETFSGKEHLIRDWVLFPSRPREAYEAAPDRIDTGRVLNGCLLLDGDFGGQINKLETEYNALKDMAVSIEEFNQILMEEAPSLHSYYQKMRRV